VTTPDENRRVVEQLWDELYRRDYDAVGSHFADDGHYDDIGAPGDGARGPAAIAARLRLGLEPLEAIVHRPATIVADGDVVITEHVEEWHWPSGEWVALPFVSVHEFRDGRIVRWHDYWNVPTLMEAAPAWWLDHILRGAAT
jgi:ketosteroid isomerase-like protein